MVFSCLFWILPPKKRPDVRALKKRRLFGEFKEFMRQKTDRYVCCKRF